jgi:1,6-anhydro-N-acetylmuramate kinase
MNTEEKARQWLDDVIDCQEKAHKLRHSDIWQEYEKDGEMYKDEVEAIISTETLVRTNDSIDFVKAVQITDAPKIAKLLGIKYITEEREGDVEFPVNYAFEYRGWRIFSLTTNINK